MSHISPLSTGHVPQPERASGRNPQGYPHYPQARVTVTLIPMAINPREPKPNMDDPAHLRMVGPYRARLGRPLRTDTNLGALIVQRNLKSFEVCSMAGISPRTLSDYVGAKKDISPHHIIALGRALRADPETILQPEQLARLQSGRLQAEARSQIID